MFNCVVNYYILLTLFNNKLWNYNMCNKYYSTFINSLRILSACLEYFNYWLCKKNIFESNSTVLPTLLVYLHMWKKLFHLTLLPEQRYSYHCKKKENNTITLVSYLLIISYTFFIIQWYWNHAICRLKLHHKFGIETY